LTGVISGKRVQSYANFLNWQIYAALFFIIFSHTAHNSLCHRKKKNRKIFTRRNHRKAKNKKRKPVARWGVAGFL
ncbi:hypothetical protein, partial [Sodaliphilus pleomorphus]|uniref:hypothetical protein n=1 Tax=Sodaliphilus pleomorphus TaxID=2606626 RepID=UPI00240A941F